MSQHHREQEEFPEPNPKFRTSAHRTDDEGAGDTAELTDVLPEDAQRRRSPEITESLSPESGELTESMGPALLSSLSGDDAQTDDVFVVLPETDSIPIVSADDVTEVGFGDDPIDDVTEDVTDDYLAGGGPDATSLDDLTSDIDDDLLAMGAEAVEDYRDFDRDDRDYDYERKRSPRGRQRRSSGRFTRVAVVCCLLLLGGVAVLFVLDPPQLRRIVDQLRLVISGAGEGVETVASAAGRGTTDPLVDPTQHDGGAGMAGEVVTSPVETGADDPKVDIEDDPSDLLVGTEMDFLAASRQFFRERVVLAFELGYVGEAEHER